MTPGGPTIPSSPDTLGMLLDQLADLLADRVADRLAAQLAAGPPPALPSRRLVTLDELIGQLPGGKKPQTWRNWLYQRTRHDQVPGCHRIGNRLFFDPDLTLPWILGTSPEGLDLEGEQSLHAVTVGPDKNSH